MGAGNGFQPFPLSTINVYSSRHAEGMRMGKGKRMEEEAMWECGVPRRKAKSGGTLECRVGVAKGQPDTLVTYTREKQRQR